MEDFYKKYQLEEYMQFNTEVLEATWHELDGECKSSADSMKASRTADMIEGKVKLQRGGEVFTDRCHVLINGSGVLTKWKWLVIEGLKSYKGALSHSAAWDDSLVWQERHSDR